MKEIEVALQQLTEARIKAEESEKELRLEHLKIARDKAIEECHNDYVKTQSECNTTEVL